MATPVFYRVVERGVQKIHGTDHREMANKFLRLSRDISKAEAPSRTTKLARGIQIKLATPSGYLRHEGRVTSTTAYSLYVHDGTSHIFPKSGSLMRVPKAKNMAGARGADLPKRMIFWAHSVRGQKANPFLIRGMQKAMAAHPQMRTITRGGL